ncbi:MAG: hypothetical protein LBC63_06650 [Holophagales bacterium]|jgi:hypothetical protein|nr:hypothetical protein [Holophagales bacterium]
MTTIQQTIEIPQDHRLHLDLPLPSEIPAGRAEVHVTIIPCVHSAKGAQKGHKPFEGLAGSLKDSVLFGRDGVELQREMRDEW